MVHAIEPVYRWPDIVLPDAVLEELREIPNHLRHSGTVLEGSVLLAAYALGLSVPFVVAAALFTPAMGAFRVVFLVDAALALVGALIAFTIRDRDAAATMRPAPVLATAEVTA